MQDSVTVTNAEELRAAIASGKQLILSRPNNHNIPHAAETAILPADNLILAKLR